MLYVIHCANHPDLAYRGGQGPIVHLEADLHSVVAWAEGNGRRWAFSLSNAGANYAEFRRDVGQLDQIDWESVAANDFRPPEVKEGEAGRVSRAPLFPVDARRAYRCILRGNSATGRQHSRAGRPPACGRSTSGLVLLMAGETMIRLSRPVTSCTADAEALVNTVNCVGVMGRGIALQFKKAFPENFKAYERGLPRGRGPARPDVRLRDRAPLKSEVHHQLPDEAALARQEPALRTSTPVSRPSSAKSRGGTSVPSPCRRWVAALAGWTGRDVRPRIEAALGELDERARCIVFEPHRAPDAEP